MDVLAGLLEGPRVHGAFLLRTMMDPPWCLRIQGHAPLSLIALVRGDAWVIPDGGDPGGDPVALHAGDVAITRGPEPYTLADDPATPPQVVIHPGQHCKTADGADLKHAMDLGVRTWGNDPSGATVMLSGTYARTTAIDATVGAVARQVGYGSPFALSSGFKRVRGVSPRQHRGEEAEDVEQVEPDRVG